MEEVEVEEVDGKKVRMIDWGRIVLRHVTSTSRRRAHRSGNPNPNPTDLKT